MTVIGDLDYEYDYVIHMMGTASTLPAEPEDETVRRLREAVSEVTGQPIVPAAKLRIGFLP
jgi:hypothetical protein